MTRWCRWMVAALAVGLFCACSQAKDVVIEWGPYEEYDDYTLYWDEEWGYSILIHAPAGSEPYQFEVYNEEDPNIPGDIHVITAEGGAGVLEITLVGHEGRVYGAANVDLMAFFSGMDVFAYILALNISGTLGTIPNTENWVFQIDGPFSVADIGKPFGAEFNMWGYLAVTGQGTHYGDLYAGHFNTPYTITIAGTMLGDITLGTT